MLREKYNTSIEMVGNTAFLPGSQLFLDPRPLDLGFTSEQGSLARSLGLGGLYVVNYVDQQIDFIKNSWTTKLDTKWESYGDGTGGDDADNIDNIDRCLLESDLTTRRFRASHLRTMASGIRDQLQRDALYNPSTNNPESPNYDVESREEWTRYVTEYVQLLGEIAEIEQQLNPEEPEDPQ